MGNASYRLRVETLIDQTALMQLERDEVSLLAPVPEPGKVVCCGLNYRDHAEEQDEELPERPMLFCKASTAVTNPSNPIIHPNSNGDEQVDYEVELAVVTGTGGMDLSESEVYDHVAGYTVLNDVSERTAQNADGQFFCGKSYDTFAPMGPALLASDDFDPNEVNVELRVDGE